MIPKDIHFTIAICTLIWKEIPHDFKVIIAVSFQTKAIRVMKATVFLIYPVL